MYFSCFNFANIVANALYPMLLGNVAFGCSYWFHYYYVHACLFSFVLMAYKKMLQCWIFIQSLSRSCSVRSLVESGNVYQQFHKLIWSPWCHLIARVRCSTVSDQPLVLSKANPLIWFAKRLRQLLLIFSTKDCLKLIICGFENSFRIDIKKANLPI
jgi:hypothetical protein